MIYYGTVISEKDVDLIENVDFQIETSGINAKVKAVHHVCNPTNDPLNATITTTFDDECSVVGFSMESDVVITSELKRKEEAKQDQADATSSGYSSTVMEKTDDTTFSLSLGLLKPHKLVKVTIEYLTKLQITDDALIVKLPAPIQKEVPFSISISGTTSFKFKGVLTGEEEIEIEDKAEGIVVMKDEDTDEIVASSTFVNHEEEGDIEVIFVCDRSGSMGGSGIEALKETLQLFLRQLPLGCKFNIISFGSRFDSMFPNSVEYDDKTLQEASKKVGSFAANYGGTNMYGPIELAMRRKCHIIALTDGSLSDKTQVLQICRSDKDNVVHSVGLGSYVDIETVRDMGRLTGGISVISKNPKDLKGAVSRITQRILTPTISNINIKWSNKGESYPKTIAKMNNELSVFLSLDESNIDEHIKSLSCTLNGMIGKKKLTITNTKPTITNGVMLHQLLAAQKIKEAETNKDIETAIKLSLRYNVLSRHTAFVAVDKSSKQTVDDIKVVKLSDIQNYGMYRFTSSITGGMPPPPPPSYYAPPRPMGAQPMCAPRPMCAQPMCAPPPPPGGFAPPPQPMCAPPPPGCAPPSRGGSSSMMQMPALQQSIRAGPPMKKTSKKMTGAPTSTSSFAPTSSLPSSNISNNVDKLNEFILLQKADGSFINVQSFYPTVSEFIKKHKEVDEVIIQTLIAIQVLLLKFAEKKVEWKLLMKKAEKFLSKKQIKEELKNEIKVFVKSL
ncbi:von Willebrand factor type A domain containing protein [Entamoeba marina]